MPSAPPSLSTRSDSSSSSVQTNSRVGRSSSAFSSLDRASLPPRFTIREVPATSSCKDFRRLRAPAIDLILVRGFIKCFLHRVQREIDLGDGNRQRRRKAHDVFSIQGPINNNAARDGSGDKAMRRERVAELDTDQQPKSSHGRNFGRAHRKYPPHKLCSNHRGALMKTLTHDYFQRGESGGARKRMTPEGGYMPQRRMVREGADQVVGAAKCPE